MTGWVAPARQQCIVTKAQLDRYHKKVAIVLSTVVLSIYRDGNGAEHYTIHFFSMVQSNKIDLIKHTFYQKTS